MRWQSRIHSACFLMLAVMVEWQAAQITATRDPTEPDSTSALSPSLTSYSTVTQITTITPDSTKVTPDPANISASETAATSDPKCATTSIDPQALSSPTPDYSTTETPSTQEPITTPANSTPYLTTPISIPSVTAATTTTTTPATTTASTNKGNTQAVDTRPSTKSAAASDIPMSTEKVKIVSSSSSTGPGLSPSTTVSELHNCYNLSCTLPVDNCLTARKSDSTNCSSQFCRIRKIVKDGNFTFEATCVASLCDFTNLQSTSSGQEMSACCAGEHCNVESLLETKLSQQRNAAAPALNLQVCIPLALGLLARIILRT